MFRQQLERPELVADLDVRRGDLGIAHPQHLGEHLLSRQVELRVLLRSPGFDRRFDLHIY